VAAALTIPDALVADVVERLLRDLRATAAGDVWADRGAYWGAGPVPDMEAYVRRQAEHWRAFEEDPGYYVEKVVGDVQQTLHDLHLDTTWPACPRHGRHPLWCHGDAWTCERDGVVVARLGELTPAR
jgi:hypothetical protein